MKFNHYVLGFTASANEIDFLKKLLHFCIKGRQSQEADDLSDSMGEDEQTSEVHVHVCNI